MWESVNAAEEARAFAEIWGVDGTVLLDETGEYAARLGIRGVPTNVLVDADGTVRAVGATTPAELDAAVSELLGTPLPGPEPVDGSGPDGSGDGAAAREAPGGAGPGP